MKKTKVQSSILFSASFLIFYFALFEGILLSQPAFTRITAITNPAVNDTAESTGVSWVDFNNDGYLDLFVANDGTNSGFLYTNNGPQSYSFYKVTTGTIAVHTGNSFGAACGDYDNDGHLDIYVANRLNQKNFLFRNNGNLNHWITVKCVGVVSNRAAIGTKVRVKAVIGGVSRWQMREITPQTGYNSGNLWLHFGLGNAAIIDSVKVEWINGLTHYFTNVSTDQNIAISETGNIIGLNAIGTSVPDKFTLYQNYPNPFNPSTKIKFNVPLLRGVDAEGGRGVFVKLIVYDILGREAAIVLNQNVMPGVYEINFNASGLTSGVYFYRLSVGSVYSETRKMILLK